MTDLLLVSGFALLMCNIRTKEEILSAIDIEGCLDALRFTPEILRYVDMKWALANALSETACWMRVFIYC